MPQILKDGKNGIVHLLVFRKVNSFTINLNFMSLMMATGSGCLVVLGPYFAVVQTSEDWMVSVYFFGYITISIVCSVFLMKRLDNWRASTALRIASFIRLALSIVIFFFLENGFQPLLMVITFALTAALPDSILRPAIATYLKRKVSDDRMQFENAIYSLSRQVGYVTGAALGGFALAVGNVHSSILLVCISLASVVGTILLKSDDLFGEIKPKKNGSNLIRLWTVLSNNGIEKLFIAQVLLLMVGFLLPASMAPLLIDVWNLSAIDLGLSESFLGIGMALGALFFAGLHSTRGAIVSFLVLSGIMFLFPLGQVSFLLSGFFTIGFGLQSAIIISSRLQVKSPSGEVGFLASNLFLLASLMAALFLLTGSIIDAIDPISLFIIMGALVFLTAVLFAVECASDK